MISEIVVFLPYSPEHPPMGTARALVDTLNVARAAVGEDLLTGAITIRIPFAPEIENAALAFLTQSGVPYEIERR